MTIKLFYLANRKLKHIHLYIHYRLTFLTFVSLKVQVMRFMHHQEPVSTDTLYTDLTQAPLECGQIHLQWEVSL